MQTGKVLGEGAKGSKLQTAGLQGKRSCDQRLLDEITGADSPLTRRPLRSVGGSPLKASGEFVLGHKATILGQQVCVAGGLDIYPLDVSFCISNQCCVI